VQATLEAITPKEALRFHDALPALRGAPPSPVTLNKYLGRLSVYWQWLRHRELVEVDPWQGIGVGVDPVWWTPLKLIFEVSDAPLPNRLSAGVRPPATRQTVRPSPAPMPSLCSPMLTNSAARRHRTDGIV
jgi:hypothetical protein